MKSISLSPTAVMLTVLTYFMAFNTLSPVYATRHQHDARLYNGLPGYADSTVHTGLFNIYRKSERYFFSIPDSVLGREMVVVTRMVKTPAGLTIDGERYGGEQENEQVWKWEKRGQKIDVWVVNYGLRSEKGPIAEALSNSSLGTILFSFDIGHRAAGQTNSVIDVTDLYSGDIAALGISDTLKKTYHVSTLDQSRSYIEAMRTFPGNIEVRTMKTYRSTGSPTDVSTGAITFEMNTSMLLLPKNPMKVRFFDPRVAYFREQPTSFGNGLQPARKISIIHRWRLEPKDSAAYLRGELVEPKKPIIFYIDPATPKEWIPYFIQGVNDWRKAFEAAGFKNAITARPAPTPQQDTAFSTEDARYSVIRYFASDEKNAYGPEIVDPRSGEVLESHIGWYHNQIKELHDWYFIQTAAANPQARKMNYSVEELGQLIRYTISHEVGHTLGLPHNWGASSAYPVDSLRSKSFTDHHGTAPSIMDYARFNYIAQPGDGVTQFNPQIGEYDQWAIEWGYRWFGNGLAADQERSILDKQTNAKTSNPVYRFGKEMTFFDPHAQHEDLGDDPLKAGGYGIENLKKILPNLKNWTYQKNQTEEDLLDMYNQVLAQYWRYGTHAVTLIGGVYTRFKTYDEQAPTYQPVPADHQRQATFFLIKEYYQTINWLIDRKELGDIDNALILNKIRSIQYDILSRQLNAARIARMLDAAEKQGNAAYTFETMLGDLDQAFFSNRKPAVSDRFLQVAYVELLGTLLKNNPPVKYDPDSGDPKPGYPDVNTSLSDIEPIVLEHLLQIGHMLPKTKDKLLSAHYRRIADKIKNITSHTRY